MKALSMKLDKGFFPMYLYKKEFEEGFSRYGSKPFFLALERAEGRVELVRAPLRAERDEENLAYAERIVKTMLWSFGGYKFYIGGDDEICAKLSRIYAPGGARAFDAEFMSGVYKKPLTFVAVADESAVPKDKGNYTRITPRAEGRRIGFDAGGSDRKVTACLNGKPVYEKEDIWFPKLNSDPAYHKAGIRDSIDKALKALGGRVDAIGVSTAGIVVDGEVRVASLFRKVPAELFEKEIAPVYLDLGRDYGCPVTVANDGDVAALAGAFSEGCGRLAGIAMGTSLAGGYIDKDTAIRGYLNEWAFIPVDASASAPSDEWSGDRGTGVDYHSQDGAIRLALKAGIPLEGGASPAEKLKIIQALADSGDPRAEAVFADMGVSFGFTALWLGEFYAIEKVLFLGRVASGKGGEILFREANKTLSEYGSSIQIILPDENSRRLGQSFTAAQL